MKKNLVLVQTFKSNSNGIPQIVHQQKVNQESQIGAAIPNHPITASVDTRTPGIKIRKEGITIENWVLKK